MVKTHSLSKICSAKEAEIEKAMGDVGSRPWPSFSIQMIRMALGKPPSPFSPSTTNYSSLTQEYLSLKPSPKKLKYCLTNSK